MLKCTEIVDCKIVDENMAVVVDGYCPSETRQSACQMQQGFMPQAHLKWPVHARLY